MPTPPELTRHNNLTKLLVLLPLSANSKRTFQCETPCKWGLIWFPLPFSTVLALFPSYMISKCSTLLFYLGLITQLNHKFLLMPFIWLYKYTTNLEPRNTHIIFMGITCCLKFQQFLTLGMHVDIALKKYEYLTCYQLRIYKKSQKILQDIPTKYINVCFNKI